MLERVEFSEGLAHLRLHIGKPVSFLNLIRNYQTLKEAHTKAQQIEAKPLISDLDEPINEVMSTEQSQQTRGIQHRKSLFPSSATLSKIKTERTTTSISTLQQDKSPLKTDSKKKRHSKSKHGADRGHQK